MLTLSGWATCAHEQQGEDVGAGDIGAQLGDVDLNFSQREGLLRVGIPAPEGGVAGWAMVFKAVGRTRTATAVIQAWQPTEGEIVETMIMSDTSGDWERFEPRVTYRYTVNGVGYTGNIIRAGGPRFNVGAASREAAEIHMAKYQLGARVTVYYDLANPAVAVLER